MVERTFRYQPVVVPNHWLTKDEHALFAATQPMHHFWLQQHAITFAVRLYRWPEWLMRILRMPLGDRVCEMHVQIAAHHAEQFAAFSGLQPD